MIWKPGDRCRLVDIRSGTVREGQIEVVRGHKMVVQTDDLRRWSADVDSSFVHRPTSGPISVTPLDQADADA